MAKNRFTCNYPNQQTPAMSPSHTYTVGVAASIPSADDEDDNDICPVCDGQCTCDNRPRLPPLTAGSNSNNGNAHHAASTNLSSPISHLPSLKIKLTVPQNMLAKKRHSALGSSSKKSRGPGGMFGAGNDGETPFSALGQALQSQALNLHGRPKRRGRPPNPPRAVPKISTDHHSIGNPSTPPRKHRHELSSGLLKTKSAEPKDKGMTVKKAAIRTKKKPVALIGSSGSDLTDLDDQYDNDDDDDTQFPTFVSASVMSTSAASSSSDSGSLSGFDTDSSIEAEEENFILMEEGRARDKAHVRRELLGDESQKRKDPHNNWVIRPRKKSVGPSDVEMDVDSDDATEDEQEDEDEDEDEGEADEEEADRAPSVGYAGVATGWSEDEESSFDADLFFANLSDSTDNGSSSAVEADDDQSDLDAMSLADLLPMTHEEMDTLPFEVTESWDGQIVFSNGLREGQGILDIDFEVNAAQLVDSSASPSQTSADVDMEASDSEDDEYEADGDFDLEESDGETTEDELVDDNGLPTERAMKLFRLPSSVSAINPLSTMSPGVSPSPRNCKRRHNRHHDSPKPSDILAGKIFYEDSDEYDHDMAAPGGNTKGARCVTSSSSKGFPTMGHFDPGDANSKRAIIDGSAKDVPSPFPRSKRRTINTGSLPGSFSGMEHSRSSSLPLASSEEVTATSSELPHAEPIGLDDVLEASFLDSDPQTPAPSSGEGDSRKHLQNLSRWDLISVGAFRQTRETANINDKGSASWASESASTPDVFSYGSMIKTSPLSPMLWHNKGRKPSKQTAGRSRADMNVVISPVILPVRDGDRTPTNVTPNHVLYSPRTPHNGKTRKELRKDKKMKRKSFPPVPYQYLRRHHHHHQHHPNSKSRSSSSMQRTNGFSASMSSVPPLNL